MNLLFLIILILYHVSLYGLGFQVFKLLKLNFPPFFSVIGILLLGLLLGIPMTYALSLIFIPTGIPILIGVITFCLITLYAFLYPGNSFRIAIDSLSHFKYSNFVLVAITTSFGYWLMMKTFHTNSSGELFVGSNNVFDFGLLIGLVRSISYGENLPFMSPYFSGFPMLYHFMFIFWCAVLEYFGVPIVWAINIPSIISFSLFLIVVFYIPLLYWKSGALAGWTAVFLTVTNSSLTFWYVLIEKVIPYRNFSQLWDLAEYPFRGPYDGSVISIFITLNNFVNQRHLALGLAIGVLLVLVLHQKLEQSNSFSLLQIVFLGILNGLYFYWNIYFWALVSFASLFYWLIEKKWKHMFIFYGFSLLCVLLGLIQYLPIIYEVPKLFSLLIGYQKPMNVISGINIFPLQLLWNNFGFLPLFAGFGFIVSEKRFQKLLLPIVSLFFIMCIFIFFSKHGLDQKLYSYLIVWLNVLASISILYIYQKREIAGCIIAVIWLFSVLLSGGIDLLPIKNEFAYPILEKDTNAIVNWISKNTPKSSIFISYKNMFDPVVMSGRNNYFGFFGNVGYYDRSDIVRKIYSGDSDEARNRNISYILVPKQKMEDFPYVINLSSLQQKLNTVYEDNKFVILEVL